MMAEKSIVTCVNTHFETCFAKRMNRRQFIGTTALGLIAAPTLAALPPAKLPTRTLGRTGITVPILGFGSGSRFLMYQDEDKALEALNRAIDLGICYIDTAHSYGNGRSEERVGKVMATRRKEVVLATKIPGRTADQARQQIELSLKRLQTDRLDVMHIHALKNAEDLAAIEKPDGVLKAFYEAREQKVTRAIGITCHADPAALQKALERHDFDCTQMALNAGLTSMTESMKTAPAGPNCFEKLALPVANKKHMGVIAMKVSGQEHLLGSAPFEKLLAYALSLPVSLASVGMPHPEHIDQNVALAKAFSPMSSRQRRRLEQSIDSGKKVVMKHFFSDHEDV
jgi:aryl-alcohol dehydrogenase-like predicted oxidoreductase